MTVFANRISKWGIASLVLLLGEIAFGEYNLYLYDHGGKPLLSFAKADQLCVVVHLASVFCGVMAMRRGSRWWVLTALPSAWMAVGCFLGEV